MGAGAPAISVRGAVKRFGAITAVDGLDLEVRSGACVGLLGPNGAGKSTLMKLLTAQAIADEGPDALYQGEIGRRYAEGLARLGAPIRPEDLSGHTAELGAPLRARYHEIDVLTHPPNSQGFVLLLALSAIERLGVDPDPAGPDAGVVADVLRAAARDRDRAGGGFGDMFGDIFGNRGGRTQARPPAARLIRSRVVRVAGSLGRCHTSPGAAGCSPSTASPSPMSGMKV